MLQKAEDRCLTDCNLLLRQLRPEFRQCNVGLLLQQSPNQILMPRQRIPLISTEFSRTDTVGLTLKPQKPTNRTEANAKPFGGLLAGRSLFDLFNHACTQVVGIRLGDPCWPPPQWGA